MSGIVATTLDDGRASQAVGGVRVSTVRLAARILVLLRRGGVIDPLAIELRDGQMYGGAKIDMLEAGLRCELD